MDLVSQNRGVASCFLTAPTSPAGLSTDNLQFHSMPSSPVGHLGAALFGYESDAQTMNDDEFEFDTSRRLANGWESEQLYPTCDWMSEKDQDQRKSRIPARAKSFSTMAIAHELFSNDQVLPLKLPPRLQNSVPTSPRSPGSVVRILFAQRRAWNDDFDPFMVALERVSEETTGRMSAHRRSRSYSPQRTSAGSHWLESSAGCDQEGSKLEKSNVHLKPILALASTNMMVGRKGSTYSRWVRSQTMVKKQSDSSMSRSPTGRTRIKGLWLGRRVRDADVNQKVPMEPMMTSQSTPTTESKMQKVKSILLKYASLRRENSQGKQNEQKVATSKPSYFKKLSLSFKEKKVSAETKMALVKHNPKLPRCLGYAPGSPPFMK